MSKKYLLKIEFDCNDADYVYGCKIIGEEDKKIIEENGNRLVSFGSCDFGEAEHRADETFSIQEITDEEAKVLERLGLNGFGEGSYWRASELLNKEIDGEDESEEDEDENESEDEDEERFPNPSAESMVLIKRTMDLDNGSYYLREKTKESNRATVHVACDLEFERITRPDRATAYKESEAKLILQELNSPEFEIVLMSSVI